VIFWNKGCLPVKIDLKIEKRGDVTVELQPGYISFANGSKGHAIVFLYSP
jgi:hypothetical protein